MPFVGHAFPEISRHDCGIYVVTTSEMFDMRIMRHQVPAYKVGSTTNSLVERIAQYNTYIPDGVYVIAMVTTKPTTPAVDILALEHRLHEALEHRYKSAWDPPAPRESSDRGQWFTDSADTLAKVFDEHVKASADILSQYIWYGFPTVEAPADVADGAVVTVTADVVSARDAERVDRRERRQGTEYAWERVPAPDQDGDLTTLLSDDEYVPPARTGATAAPRKRVRVDAHRVRRSVRRRLFADSSDSAPSASETESGTESDAASSASTPPRPSDSDADAESDDDDVPVLPPRRSARLRVIEDSSSSSSSEDEDDVQVMVASPVQVRRAPQPVARRSKGPRPDALDVVDIIDLTGDSSDDDDDDDEDTGAGVAGRWV